MKDAAHHLKHVQKKVLQEIRKTSRSVSKESLNNHSNPTVNHRLAFAQPKSG
ncbi:MAG: hypothetical protein J0H93_05290 [Chlamydiales bacterium]|nr:hypothetical protein [Chlamydiales bacterium]